MKKMHHLPQDLVKLFANLYYETPSFLGGVGENLIGILALQKI